VLKREFDPRSLKTQQLFHVLRDAWAIGGMKLFEQRAPCHYLHDAVICDVVADGYRKDLEQDRALSNL